MVQNFCLVLLKILRNNNSPALIHRLYYTIISTSIISYLNNKTILGIILCTSSYRGKFINSINRISIQVIKINDCNIFHLNL